MFSTLESDSNRKELLEAAIAVLQPLETDLQSPLSEHTVAQERLDEVLQHLRQLGNDLQLPGLKLVVNRLKPILQRSYSIPQDASLRGLLQQAFACVHQILVAYLQSDRVGVVLAEAQPMFDMLAARCDLHLQEPSLAQGTNADNLLVSDFLKVEIAPILETLKSHLTQNEPEQRIQAYIAHLDVLRQLGRLLQLSKFAEIAQDSITDLRATPTDFSRIIQVGLLRFQGIYHALVVPLLDQSSLAPESQSFETQRTGTALIAQPLPPTTSPLRSQVVVDFLATVPIWMDEIEADLFTLKTHWSLNKVNDLMRNTHTLKGAAVGPELSTIKSIAHSLETFFRILSHPDVELDGHLEVLLFQAYECLRQAILLKSMDTSITEVDLRNRASSIFEQLQDRLAHVNPDEVPLPSALELGVDIVHSMFEMEVEPRLQAIAARLDQQEQDEQSDRTRLLELLQENSEIFLGIAEAFDLQGFGAIAHTTLQALQYHPEQIESIAQLALMDFRNGQSQILAGERSGGGQPSAALQRLAQLAEIEVTSGTEAQVLKESVVGNPGQANPTPLWNVNGEAPTTQLEPERLITSPLAIDDLLPHYYQQATFHEQLHGYLDQFQAAQVQHQTHLTQLYELTQGFLNLPLQPENQEIKPARNAIQSLWESTLTEGTHLSSLATKLVTFHQQASDLLSQCFQHLSTARTQVLQSTGVPLTETFHRVAVWFEQLVADYDKAADLSLQGGELCVDPAIAQPLYDVLLHLLRNAYDHGLESPELRRRLGKPECGQIVIQATQHGEQCWIEVQDDGAGLDFGRIGDHAVQLGLISIEAATTVPGEELLDLIFEPGFSTAPSLTELSGRGVGLDVVRAKIQALQGAISVRSQPDEGTTFLLRIPSFPLPASTMAVTTPSIFESDSAVESPESPMLRSNELENTENGVLEELELPEQESLILSLEDVFGRNLIANELQSNEIGTLEETEAPAFVPVEDIDITEPASPDPSQHPELSRIAEPYERILDTKQLFVWQSGNLAFVLSYNCIEEHIVPSAGQLLQVQQQRFLQWRHQILPLYRLSDFLLPSDHFQIPNESETEGSTVFLIIRLGQQLFALESAIQHLITVPTLAVNPLHAKGYAPLYIYGTTSVQRQTNLVLIDAETLLQQALGIPEDRIATSGFVTLERIGVAEGGGENREDQLEGTTITKQSVLVIDDSKMVREILKMTLEGAGYQVFEAQNGQVALDLVPQFSGVDLIICDVAMPKMNGFDFLRNCRQYPTYAAVPVIMLSNCDGEVHQQLAFRLGAVAYFTKPYNEQKLLDTVKNLINSHIFQ